MAEPINPSQIVNTAEDSGLQTYSDNLQNIPRLTADSNIYVTEVVNNSYYRNSVSQYFLPENVVANGFPALPANPPSANVGSVYYNTDVGQLLVYDGTNWSELGSGVTAANVFFQPTATLFSTNVQAVVSELQSKTLALTGGALTGPLTLSSTPTTALQAATKAYVDLQGANAENQPFTPSGNIVSTTIRGAINELNSDKLDVAGGIMTGFLTLNANPTQPLQAVTKQYVDALVAPSGVNTQVLFIDNGVPTGDVGFTYNKTTQSLTLANSITLANVTASGNVIASGNISALNGALSGNLSVTGNTTAFNSSLGGNLVAVGNITGLNGVYSGNITAGGNMVATNYNGSGNAVMTGNIQANVGFIGNSLTTRDGPMTITSTGVYDINLAVGTGNIALVTQTNITNVRDPVNPQDAATKRYVDALTEGLQIKDTCNAATTTTLAASSGGAISYNNGVAGVGATLTTTGTFATIDGVSLTAGDRVLVKNEAITAYNGIYQYVNATTLVRAADSDAPLDLDSGSFVFITGGTVNVGAGFVQTNDTTTVGTSPVLYSQFSGAGGYSAGTGLVLVGSTFNLTNTTVTAGSYGNATHSASFTVDAQGRLTAASASAITANAETLLGTTLNSTVVNSSLTSVGTLTTLTVTGTATVGNVSTAGNITATGNISGGNINTGGQVIATGNVVGSNLVTAGNVVATGNVSGGNLNTAGNVVATGNVSGGNVTTTGNMVATGNVTGGNVTTTGNMVATGNVTGGNVTTAGAVVATGNISGGNISTAGNVTVTGDVTVTGNVTAGNLLSTTALSAVTYTATATTGTAPFNVSSTTRVPNLNVDHANVSDFAAVTAQTTGVFYPTLVSGSTGANYALGVNSAVSFDAATGAWNSTLLGGTLTTGAQPNITSVGTLTSLTVTGNVAGGNLTTGGQVVATGNVVGSNINTAGIVSATGNVIGGNLVTNGVAQVTGNVIGGNLVTGGQVVATGNVSGGNVTTGGQVVATGNVSGGNITTAGQVAATGNVTGSNLNTAGKVVAGGNIQANTAFVGNALTTRDGPMTITSTGSNNITLAVGTGNIALATQTYITNVKDPLNAQDAATKFYVDSVAQGLKPKAAVNVCAGTNINLASAPATIDGVSPAAGDRVLVQGQTNTAENGIYTYNGAGAAMTRTADADTAAELPDGTFVFVEGGATYGATGHVLTSIVTTLGTDPVIFTQFAAAASYLAGVGLNLTGTTFNLADTAVAPASYGNATHVGSFTVDQQGRLTAASNVEITANAELLTGTTLKSTVVNSSLTSVGTLTTLAVTGTATVGNVSTAGNVTASGNVSGGNLTTAGQVSATGNISGGNVTTAGQVVATGNVSGGNVTTGGQVVATGNVVSSANITATGNISGGNISTAGSLSVTGNVSGGNITTGGQVVATGNVVSSANITATGNVSGGNLTTVGEVSATGNVSGGNLTTAGQVVATGNVVSSANISATGNVTGGNVTTAGQVVATGNISGGNVTTGGQVVATGNVVSSANVTATGNVSGGNLTTVGVVDATGNISGGNITTSGQVVATGNVVGSNFNTAGNITATGNLSAGNITTSGTFSVTGNVSGDNINTTGQVVATGNVVSSANITATGNVTGGNLTTAGVVTATGNVVGGNITTGGQVIATGNVVGSNLSTGGTVTATGNVSGGNITTGGQVVATGNVSGGNIITGGVVSATGNVTGGNLTTSGQVVATGNVEGSNLNTAGNVVATGNIQANTGFIGNSLTTRDGPMTITATGSNNIVLTTGTGNVDLSPSTHITNLKDPVNPQDAATKFYVDSLAQGLKPKASVKAATTADITLSGTQTIDGVSLSAGDRVLVKNQAASADNGIYVVDGGAWSRAADYDSASDAADGSFIFVDPGGTVNGSSGFVQTSTVVTLGTDPIVYAQFSSGGSYTAGVGLNLSGSQFNLADTSVGAASYGNATHTATFTVDAQGRLTAASNVEITANAELLTGTTLKSTVVNSSLTSVGTLTSLAVTGNVDAGNVNGTEGNFTTVTGSLVTAAQPNITSVGTLTSLTVTGTTTAGNVSTAGNLSVTGASTVDFDAAANVSLGAVANVHITGGSAGQVLKTDGSGGLSWGGTLPLANGTSNVDIPAVNGNVVVTTNGAHTWKFAADGNLVLSTGGNIVSGGATSPLNILSNGSVYVRSNGAADITLDAALNGDVVSYGANVFLNAGTTATSSKIVWIGGGNNNANLTSASSADRGTALKYYDTGASASRIAFVGWDNSANEILLATNVTIASDIVTVGNLGNVRLGNLTTEGNVTIANLAVTGNTTSGNLSVTANTTTANLSVTANAVVTGNVTAGNVNVSGTGNITLTNGNVIGRRFIVDANGISTAGGTLDWTKSLQYFTAGAATTLNIPTPPQAGLTAVVIVRAAGAFNISITAGGALSPQQFSSGTTGPFATGGNKAVHFIVRSFGTGATDFFVQVDSTL